MDRSVGKLVGFLIFLGGLFLTCLWLPHITVSYRVPYETIEEQINVYASHDSLTFWPNKGSAIGSQAYQIHSGHDLYLSFTTDQPLDISIYDSRELEEWLDYKTRERASPILVKKHLSSGSYRYRVEPDAYGFVVTNDNPSTASVTDFVFGECKDVQVTKYRTEYGTDYTRITLSVGISIAGLMFFVVSTKTLTQPTSRLRNLLENHISCFILLKYDHSKTY